MIAVFRLVLARTLARCVGVAAITTALALVAAGPPPAPHEPLDGGALWLHLPVTLIALTAVATGLEAWPGFGAGRPGRAIVDRLAVGWADGTVAAALASLCAAAACLAAVGWGFAAIRGVGPDRAPTAAAAWHFADGAPVAALHADAPRATLVLDDPRIERVTLRPRFVVVPGQPIAGATLRVVHAGDGRELVPPTELPWDGAPLCIPIEAGTDAVVVERAPGPGFALVLDPVRVHAERPGSWGARTNAMLAALMAGLPVAVALAAAVAGRRRLGLGVLTFVGLGLLLAGPGIGLAPQVAGIDAAAAGQSCLASPPLPGVSS